MVQSMSINKQSLQEMVTAFLRTKILIRIKIEEAFVPELYLKRKKENSISYNVVW